MLAHFASPFGHVGHMLSKTTTRWASGDQQPQNFFSKKPTQDRPKPTQMGASMEHVGIKFEHLHSMLNNIVNRWPKMPRVFNLSPSCTQLGSNFGSSWHQLGPNLAPISFQMVSKIVNSPNNKNIKTMCFSMVLAPWRYQEPFNIGVKLTILEHLGVSFTLSCWTCGRDGSTWRQNGPT